MANNNVILQWNCRGLKSKRLELETLIAKYSPAVVCVQETLLHPNIETNQNNDHLIPFLISMRFCLSFK